MEEPKGEQGVHICQLARRRPPQLQHLSELLLAMADGHVNNVDSSLVSSSSLDSPRSWEQHYETTGELPVGYDPSITYEYYSEYQQPTQQQIQQYAQAWEAALVDEYYDEDPEEDDDVPPPPPPAEEPELPPTVPILPAPISTAAQSPHQAPTETFSPRSGAAIAGLKVRCCFFMLRRQISDRIQIIIFI